MNSKHPAIRSDFRSLESIPAVEKQKISEPSNVAMRLLLAGGISGCLTKTTTAPLERVKILLQLQTMKDAVSKVGTGVGGRPLKAAAASRAASSGTSTTLGIFGTVSSVLKNEGVLAFWKGNGANCIRVIPVYGLKFGLNDSIKDSFRKEPGAPLTTSAQLLAGTLAGVVTVTATYPLDVVRTRLSLSSGFGVEYKGILDCAYQTLRFEGFRGLYKGYLTTIITGSPYVGMQMTGYEIFKGHLPCGEDGSTAAGWKVVAGAMAGICAQTVTFPGDTVRRRMQANGVAGGAPTYTGTIDCVLSILRTDGAIGFFHGYSANLIRSLPAAGIQFLAYDTSKQLLGL